MIRSSCVLLAFVLAGCATSPTGRKQLELVPDSQMHQMGQQAFAQMKDQQPVSDDPALTRYVDCIAREVLDAAEDDIQLEAEKWEVVVFDSDQVNAFALPGGRVGVYRGMVEFAETPSQLASVVAHEVAHVVADHGNARVSEQMAIQGIVGLTAVLTEQSPERDALLAALGLGSQVGVTLPHSRAQESEADLMGLRYMTEAGFEPRAAVRLWERMAERSGQRPPELLSTHPKPESRARELARKIEQHPERYAPAGSPSCPAPEALASQGADSSAPPSR
jgi:predicted Zn-dependent protease